MAYATVADATTLYGASYVAVACDRDLDGSVDTTSFEYHLTVASDQIDGYLLGRYALPLATPPAIFTKVCVDLAIYNCCSTADVLTDEIKRRNDAAVQYLRDIASNKVKLKIADDTTEINESKRASITTQRVQLLCGSREFRTRSLRRIL